MRFVIYKNSVLATLCSIFGASFIAMAVMAMVSGELEILSGIILIVAGIGLMWLGDLISTKKAERKRRKAQQAAGASASTTGYAQPQSYAPAAQGSPVNGSAVFAGLFFLMATAMGLWSVFSPYHSHLDYLAVVECAGFLLLAIGCFQMKHTQRANAFHLIGAFLPASVCAYSAFNLMRALLSQGSGDAFAMNLSALEPGKESLILCALAILAFLMMLLFAARATKSRGTGGLTGALWFLPAVILAVHIVLQLEWNVDLNRMVNDFIERPRWMAYPIMLDLYRNILVIVACFLAGLCFRRICRSPVAVPRLEARDVQPEPRYAPPVPSVQPAPHYTAPESVRRPGPTPRASEADVQKQIQAYRDLLECGILTREECEQKVRELTREYYGGSAQ